MDVQFTLHLPGEPAGQIRLNRLVEFVQRFRTAVFRSAQAEFSIPTYRKTLGSEPRPEFRLAGLREGSTSLLLQSVEDRSIDQIAVTRHLDALSQHRQSHSWPKGVYTSELQAWGAVYESVLLGSPDATVQVSSNGLVQLIDATVVTDLSKARVLRSFRHISCVGDLHLIEISRRKNPRFRIDADEVDLVFDLSDDLIKVVDPLRWRRVKADASWEVGTNRAQLVGAISETDDPPGVEYLDSDDDEAAWLSLQTQRLEAFRELIAGWDGPASKPIRRTLIESAQELAGRIASQFATESRGVNPPYFFPGFGGTVEFEWQVEDRFLVCELVDGGYDVLVTEDDTTLFEGVAGQRSLFTWLNWLLTGTARP